MQLAKKNGVEIKQRGRKEVFTPDEELELELHCYVGMAWVCTYP